MRMVILLIIFFFCLPDASAQQVVDTDYILEENQPGNMILFNGRVYQSPNFNRQNHPFLDANTWMTGRIIIEEQIFYSIPLKYDIIDDQIVMNLTHLSSGISIQPTAERINGFSLGTLNFVRLSQSDFPECQSGFYEVKCSGIYTLYIRYRKQSQKTDASSYIWPTSENYYLRHGGQLSLIKNRSDLKKFFYNDIEILDYIQQQHFPIKISNSESLIQLCNHLNSCNIDP